MCRYINPLTLKRFRHISFPSYGLCTFAFPGFPSLLVASASFLIHPFDFFLYREDHYFPVLICTQNTQVVLAHHFSTWRLLPYLLSDGDPREGNRFMFPGLMRDEGQQDGIVAHHGTAIRPAGVDESRNDIPSQTS
jgi:hypothetical protein